MRIVGSGAPLLSSSSWRPTSRERFTPYQPLLCAAFNRAYPPRVPNVNPSQVIWSCKEAFIKARGDGMGFAPLRRINVRPSKRLPGSSPLNAAAEPQIAGCQAAVPQDQGQQQQEGSGYAAGSSASELASCLASGLGLGSSQPAASQPASIQPGSNTSESSGTSCCSGGGVTGTSASYSPAPRWRSACLEVDGVAAQRWAVALSSLPGGHWVAVARAPPDAIVDAHGVSVA